MKTLFKIISFAGLGLMIVTSIMVFTGQLTKEAYHLCTLVGTVAWFATVPFWMKRRLHHSE